MSDKTEHQSSELLCFFEERLKTTIKPIVPVHHSRYHVNYCLQKLFVFNSKWNTQRIWSMENENKIKKEPNKRGFERAGSIDDSRRFSLDSSLRSCCFAPGNSNVIVTSDMALNCIIRVTLTVFQSFTEFLAIKKECHLRTEWGYTSFEQKYIRQPHHELEKLSLLTNL